MKRECHAIKVNGTLEFWQGGHRITGSVGHPCVDDEFG